VGHLPVCLAVVIVLVVDVAGSNKNKQKMLTPPFFFGGPKLRI